MCNSRLFFLRTCCFLFLKKLEIKTFIRSGVSVVFKTKHELKCQNEMSFLRKHQFLCFHYWDYLTNFWRNNWRSIINIVERLWYSILLAVLWKTCMKHEFVEFQTLVISNFYGMAIDGVVVFGWGFAYFLNLSDHTYFAC